MKAVKIFACMLMALVVVAMVFAWLMYVFDDREEDQLKVVPFSTSTTSPGS